jgi:putative phage-type endonuclease
MSDSDYIASSDINTETESTTSEESTPQSILGFLSEDEIAEITIQIYHELDEYQKENMLYISKPNFYSTMKITIAQSIYEDWLDYEICEEDDFEDIIEFVNSVTEVYLEICEFPKRSIAYSTMPDYIFMPDAERSRISRQIEYLQRIPQPKQKTKEWYEFRNNLITASNLWKALGSESQRNSLIYEKCRTLEEASRDTTGFCNTESPMHWGVKYEPVTVMVYEDMFQTKIGEFGCIQHPKYSFIGASPDGINVDSLNPRYGRMLEIKNIKNREITGIPKEEYWVQTQIQMETCDLNECDFVETRFLEYQTEQDFYEDTQHDYRGVILGFTNQSCQSEAPTYQYMPLDVPINKESITEWIRTSKNSCKLEGFVLYSTMYWYMDEFSCVLITRNSLWFHAAIRKIEELWQIVLKERVDGCEHRASKKRVIKTEVSADDTSNKYKIHNLSLTNSICLVKLP